MFQEIPPPPTKPPERVIPPGALSSEGLKRSDRLSKGSGFGHERCLLSAIPWKSEKTGGGELDAVRPWFGDLLLRVLAGIAGAGGKGAGCPFLGQRMTPRPERSLVFQSFRLE